MNAISQHTSMLDSVLAYQDRRERCGSIDRERKHHGRHAVLPGLMASWVDE